MREADLDYFVGRIEQDSHAALVAETPEARRVHRQLADEYAGLILASDMPLPFELARQYS